jgi:hypothetical protein
MSLNTRNLTVAEYLADLRREQHNIESLLRDSADSAFQINYRRACQLRIAELRQQMQD